MKNNNHNLKDSEIIKEAKKVLDIEAKAVANLQCKIDENFINVVEILFKCNGRIVVTGIGKSGMIARKIAATLASTGTPALFLHPAEGAHGDLGVVLSKDVILAVSNSGETEEIILMLPIIKRIGAKIVTLTGGRESTLAQNSDAVLEINVKEEACPFGLSPTASTTAVLAMGDAISIALLKKRNFCAEDYAFLHPGGNIGRKMLVKVEDIMHTGNEIPVVNEDATMKESIIEMTTKKMGCTAVVNKKEELVGIITDQDLRLELEKNSEDFLNKKIKFVMTMKPKTIDKNALVGTAIRITEEKSISTLLVVDSSKKPIGVVHLHDLLKTNI